MKHNIYCMKDNLIGYGAPFCDTNDDVAKRNFMVALMNMQAPLRNDLDLYKLGTFDSDDCTFDVDMAKLLLHGASVVDKERSVNNGLSSSSE